MSYPTPIKIDGLTTPDPAAQGGARSTLDPWKDGANDGKKPIVQTPKARELMTSQPSGDLSTKKPSNFTDIVIAQSLYDPVRDVQPSTPSGPAPAATSTGDPWFDAGDNGREVYPNSQDKTKKWIKNIVEKMQGVRTYPPIPALNLNAIGSTEEGTEEDSEELQPAEEPLRNPSELDQHLVANHYMEFNPTLYPVDAIQDLHMELHASGQAADHNPEVTKVASLNYILGSKDEELNFLPVVSRLIEFPPVPGQEENWMFPYAIQERFVESPKNRGRQ